jgi:hypothetical protein
LEHSTTALVLLIIHLEHSDHIPVNLVHPTTAHAVIFIFLEPLTTCR